MTPVLLLKRLREYDSRNHRGKYALICREAADYIEGAFAELTAMKPEQPAEPRRKNTWALTPLGIFGQHQCAVWIDIMRKRGSNALIINEKGALEFGTVERSDAAREQPTEGK